MLYFLSEFSRAFGPFRLFEYVTFRAGGAAFTAFLLVVLFGGAFARLLRHLNLRAADRYTGLIPDELLDKRKNSTPCMGGVLLIGAILIATLLWGKISDPIPRLLAAATFGFALLGFADDFLKVFRQNRDGLPGRYKLLVQTLLAALTVWLFQRIPEVGSLMENLMVPFCKDAVWQSPLVLVFDVVVIVGVSNAVNLTDGKDGLASGCTVFCCLVYAGFAYLMGHKVFAGYLSIPFIPGVEEAVVFASAICGGAIGFLWHNCHPAAMFMGDTGSLALGGAIGLLAVLVRQEILLLLVGGVFVMEAGSVMLQVASFKLTGKRIFLCSPIHHHFERKGWTETQIVVRFWILSGIFALMALATLKLR